MIDISSLPTPAVLQTLDFEEIKQEIISTVQSVKPDWEALESDDYMPLIEANAYREIHLRKKFNSLALAFFIATATGDDLDNWGALFDCVRLQGEHPYDTYTFTLSEAQVGDITISSGLVLSDDESIYEATLQEDVIISAGELEGSGKVELQLSASSSDVQTVNITTPLPYVVTAASGDGFKNGSEVESDEEFRARIFISMADKSTAGASETYESFTYSSDERISDVNIERLEAGTVHVFYYSKDADATMQENINSSLNDKQIRPLSDTVIIDHVEVINIDVTASLVLEENVLSNEVLSNAIASLKAGLKTLEKIKEDITLSEINDFLKVAGVKEVIISGPNENYVISYNQIGVQNELNITIA
ncbi:MAG: baseplate assembly protein [Arcobacter sp.]|mgnify:CR=1 FL=1|nr:MAG: baseplate assembly protein [Arcobacter sp.]